jgi:hypothetical protein
MSGSGYTDPGYTIRMLDQLEPLGFTDGLFRLVHHRSRHGTVAETISRMRKYCLDLLAKGAYRSGVPAIAPAFLLDSGYLRGISEVPDCSLTVAGGGSGKNA